MIARLVRDPRGATFVEFALLSPVLCLLLLGALDICHRAYAQALLSGAVQAAGRKGTLEGNDTTAAALAIDEAVIRQIRPVAPHLRWTSNRAHYRSYDSVAAEPFNDANGNGSRDAGECFTDINANKRFDLDAGATGQGGANDVTVYTMTVTFPRLFPMSRMLGLPRDQVVSSTTSLKNQPYGSQSSEAPETLCT